MNIKNSLFSLLVATVLLFSCVSQKKVDAIRQQLANSQADYQQTAAALGTCKTQDGADKQQIADLSAQIDKLKDDNNSALGKLDDMSVISKDQGASIKQSMADIRAKEKFIKELMAIINRKDSINDALVNNLKAALVDINDKDINVKIEKGVVYIDISDKLLFKSGSYSVTEIAKEV